MLGAAGAICQGRTDPPPQPQGTYEEQLVDAVGRELMVAGIAVDARKLAMEMKSVDEIHSDLDAQLDLGLQPEVVEVLWMLRGILEATPAINTVRRLREEAVAARLPGALVYYVTDRRALVFVDAEEVDEDVLAVALASQLVHVFYDQGPGGLTEALYDPRGELDGVRVRKCLFEGHARLAELLVRYGTLDDLDEIAISEIDPPPEQLRATLSESLCGPGARYLYNHYRQGGWEGVLRAVRNPPSSTEQLMHPAKVDQDFPANVALPRWPDDEFEDPDPMGVAKLVHESVLGELTMYRLLLERAVEPDTALRAVVGWDGDRLRIYEHETEGRVVVWRSVWDREVDAEQFAAAIAPKGIEPRAFRVVRHGRVVDAVSTPGPNLARQLHEVLSERPGEPKAQPADAASTSAIEARLGR